MQKYILPIATVIIFSFTQLQAQVVHKIGVSTDNSKVFNREASFDDNVIHLDARENAGMLWLKDSNFENGSIELDIKGTNTPGRSFVGLLFHGLDDETYDAIYFRPFNFRNPQKSSNSVQYISLPDHDWSILRKNSPGKYENTMNPVPESEDAWFHVRIEIDHPKVKVFINGSSVPTLEVDQLSKFKEGLLGFWVGHNSEGWFKNLEIIGD